MGRIQRVATSTTPVGLDLGTSGKLLLHVITTDCRIAYDSAMTDYFTLTAGNQYVIDQPATVGEYQLMYVATGASTGVLEVWVTEAQG